MTFRLTLCAAALVAFAGCSDTAGPDGAATDLDGEFGLTNPFETLAYDSGYQLGSQIAEQDSAFSLDLFEKGFRDGIAGDSAQIAYALGLQYGLNLAADTVSNVSSDFFLAAFEEGFRGDSVRVTPARVQSAQRAARDTVQLRDLRSRARTDSAAAGRLRELRDNTASSERYLQGLSGVQTTESGLRYKVVEPGQGASPSESDRVKVTYTGTLPDGTEFDAGEEVEFNVSGVVPGFSEALKGMKPGERRTIYIPASLGYGMSGAPGPGGQGGIPPNTALTFDVTLVEVLPPSPQGGMGGMSPEMLQQMMQQQGAQ